MKSRISQQYTNITQSICVKIKMRTLVKTFLCIAVTVLLFYSIPNETHAETVIVDTAVQTTIAAHVHSSPTSVCVTVNDCFIFYLNSTGGLAMSSSTDGGLTWLGERNVDATNTTDVVNFAIWYDGWTAPGTTTDAIHIAATDSSVDDVYYIRYDIAARTFTGSTLGTTQAATCVLATAPCTTSITKASDNRLFMAVGDTQDVWVVSCAANCTLGPSWSERTGLMTSASYGDDHVILMPIVGTNNVLLTRWDISADTIVTNIWSATSTTWKASTTILTSKDDNTTYDGQLISQAMSTTTGVIGMAIVDDANDYTSADHDINFFTYASTTNTWTARTNVVTTAVGGLTGVKVTYDERNGVWYVVYARRSTIGAASSADIYYSTSSDNGVTWSPERGPINTTDPGNYYALSTNFNSREQVGVWWSSTTPSGTFVYYDRIKMLNLPPSSVTLNSPADASSGSDATPVLDFTGTDPDANDIEYLIQIASSSTFGTEVASDDFNRANGGLGANWSDYTCCTYDPPLIVSNAVGATADDTDAPAYWSGAGTFSDDQYSQATITWGDNGVGGSFAGVIVRAGASSFIGAYKDPFDYNRVYVFDRTGIAIGNEGDGSLIAVTDHNIANGSVVRLEAIGNQVFLYDDGVLIASGTTTLTTGKPGFITNAVNDSVDNWSGGSISTLIAHSTSSPGFANPDVGGDTTPFSSGHNIQYTVQNALDPGTYYWRVSARDPFGSRNYGTTSSIRSFTVTGPPTVVLNTPLDASSDADTTPTFDFTGTDLESDDIEYRIQIDTSNSFNSSLETIAFVASTSAQSSDNNDVTTAAIDTTGADFLVVTVTDETGNTRTISDSKGNTWRPLTAEQDAGSTKRVQLFYATTSLVGTGHTFSVSDDGASTYPSIAVVAFSGVASTSPFDAEAAGATHGGTDLTIQPGSISPAQDNELFVTGLNSSYGNSNSSSIDSSFIKTADIIEIATADAIRMAYKIQTTGSSENPTWTVTGNGVRAAVMAAFKAEPAPLIDAYSTTSAGFVNPDVGGDTNPFSSGHNIQYTVQGADTLPPGTYYWRVAGKDYSGSNTFGDWSETRSFTITPPPTILLSGTLYSDEGVTPITSGKTIGIAIGTSTPSVHATTSTASGAWSFSPVSTYISTTTPILVWVDGDTSTRGALFTKASSTNNIAGLDLYRDRVIVSHEGTSGTSTTLSDMSFYDRDDDGDIPFTATGNSLIVHAGNELHIKTGKTFSASGTVEVRGNASATTTDGSIHLAPSSRYIAVGDTTLGGSLTASSSATFSNATGTLLFNATTTNKTVLVPLTNLGTTTFSGSNGGWTLGTTSTTTNLTITAGTVTAPSSTLTITGNYANSGTFTHNSGTVLLNGTQNQTLSGSMIGTSAFNNLTILNTSGAGASSQSIHFAASASTTDTFRMIASTSARFLANATSTFQNINLAGATGQYVWLRSSVTDTKYGFYVPGTQTAVSYVNVRDSNACPATINANDGTNVDGGNNSCWLFTSATISSAANQSFDYLGATTSISTITVTDATSPTITAANDIRILIATTSVNMRWDTTDVTATFGGTASGKVSNTVSYLGNGAMLLIDVTENFAASDTLTISGLSFAQFNTVIPATVALKLRTEGVGTTTTSNDDKTVAIKGTLVLSDHTSGQVIDIFDEVSNESDVELFAFRLAPAGESPEISSLTIDLMGVNRVEESHLTNLRLYRDLNSDKAYSLGEPAVGGAGDITISGQSGTIVFSTAITATTTQNYVLVSDIVGLTMSKSLNVHLNTNDIIATGPTSLTTITVTGSATSIEHRKGNPGGGSSSPIGGAAPAGDGIQTGGEEGGGEGIGDPPPEGGEPETGGGGGGGGAVFKQPEKYFAAVYPALGAVGWQALLRSLIGVLL